MLAMQAVVLMVLATALFAAMGVTVKLSAAGCSAGEIVFYRGVVGVLLTGGWARWQGVPLRTRLPGMHAWRGGIGVLSMALWFHAIAQLPLSTAVTLNYMSSVWMAVFLLGGAMLAGTSRVDARMMATVLAGFLGVVLILQPTLHRDQVGGGLAGLMSGLLSALAYLQVGALGRAGEPEPRVVFYFSWASLLLGGALAAATGGLRGHDLATVLLLLSTGVLATLAQLLMTRAYALGRPLTNASLQYLGIVYSVGLGAWLFDDPFTSTALAGTALIVLAGISATLLRHASGPAPRPQAVQTRPRGPDD